MEELKNCPFCGKKPQRGYYEPIDGHGLYSIECGWCEIAPSTPDYNTKAKAIKAWNTRYQIPTHDVEEFYKEEEPGKEKRTITLPHTITIY